MKYDFSRAETDAIKLLVKRTADTLAAKPSSENAAEWKEYIAAGNAELNKRKMKMYAIVGVLVLPVLYFLFAKKKKRKWRSR